MNNVKLLTPVVTVDNLAEKVDKSHQIGFSLISTSWSEVQILYTCNCVFLYKFYMGKKNKTWEKKTKLCGVVQVSGQPEISENWAANLGQ